MLDCGIDILPSARAEMKIPLPGVRIGTWGKGTVSAETRENCHVIMETLEITGREGEGDPRVESKLAEGRPDSVVDLWWQMLPTGALLDRIVHGFDGADLKESGVKESEKTIVIGLFH